MRGIFTSKRAVSMSAECSLSGGVAVMNVNGRLNESRMAQLVGTEQELDGQAKVFWLDSFVNKRVSHAAEAI